MGDKREFTDRFRGYVDEKNMTLGMLSVRTGIDRRTLSCYYSGRSVPTVPRLKALALGTGRSADWWCGV